VATSGADVASVAGMLQAAGFTQLATLVQGLHAADFSAAEAAGALDALFAEGGGAARAGADRRRLQPGRRGGRTPRRGRGRSGRSGLAEPVCEPGAPLPAGGTAQQLLAAGEAAAQAAGLLQAIYPALGTSGAALWPRP